MKMRSSKETDQIMRDHFETTHFYDPATGKLVEKPVTLPPDPSPESEEGDA